MLELIGTRAEPLVTGHRGAAGECPENTMAAFEHAIAVGCDGVELDVHMSADDVPVVVHDGSLTDERGVRFEISDRTAAEIVKLRSGDRAIPLLDDVLELLADSRLYAQIELKGPGVEAAVVDLIKRHGMKKRAMCTSFVHSRVLTIKRLLPELRTGVLLSSVPVRLIEVAHRAYADNIHLDHRRISGEVVDEVHRCGKGLVAWGMIGEEYQFDRLFELGVDIIGSDWPTKLLARRNTFFHGGRRATGKDTEVNQKHIDPSSTAHVRKS